MSHHTLQSALLNKYILINGFVIFSAFINLLIGQAVSINTDASLPHASAILDIKSTEKGVLVPRISTGQRAAIVNPATGLLVYNTNTEGFWFFNGSVWENLSTRDRISDADGDTWVHVEMHPDEDIIRFTIDSTQALATILAQVPGIPV